MSCESKGARMPNGKEFPMLFNFKREGMFHERCSADAVVLMTNLPELSVRPDLIRQLVPPHCEPELGLPGYRVKRLRAHTIGRPKDNAGLTMCGAVYTRALRLIFSSSFFHPVQLYIYILNSMPSRRCTRCCNDCSIEERFVICGVI